MDLKEVLRQAKEDESYFKQLYDLTVDRVFAYASIRLHDREIAKEVVQEVYLALWQSIHKFIYISDAHFYSFLFTVVRRKLIKARMKKVKEIRLDDVYDVPGELNVKEDYRFLLRELDKLKEKEKQVIQLRYFQDLDFQTIAEVLDISLENAKVLNHRGIKKLKKLMSVYE